MLTLASTKPRVVTLSQKCHRPAKGIMKGHRRCSMASESPNADMARAGDSASFSIFERMQPKAGTLDNTTLQLASPSDVPLQFRHAATAKLGAECWEALSVTAVKSLRYFRVSEVAAILDSCAQASWKDDQLLCGLSEAFRCGAELRRGTVRDYTLCLQSLRRLQYCPWRGALDPIVAELRWRLRWQRWRPLDLVLSMRFLAAFTVPQGVPQGVPLFYALQDRAEECMGQMKHQELSHFARAVIDFGRADAHSIERIAENFSRRADDVPLSVLVHFAGTLIRANASAPAEFKQLISVRAQQDLATLKPVDMAFVASACARLSVNDTQLLKSLGRGAVAILDDFSFTNVGRIVEAFDLLGFTYLPLLRHVEQQLKKDKSPSPGQEDARLRMLAAVLVASSKGPSVVDVDFLSACSYQLCQSLSDLQSKDVKSHVWEKTVDPPTIPRSKPVRTRWTQSVKPRSPRCQPQKPQENKNFGGDRSFMDADSEQLDALREIADSVCDSGVKDLVGARKGGIPLEPFMSEGARRRRSGVVVPGFAPTGSTVVRVRCARRQHFERILGGKHPAERRVHRRLRRLERELNLPHGAPLRETSIRDVRRVRGAPARVRAAILWRRLRRFRLSGFEPGKGSFAKVQTSRQRPRLGLSLDHAVVLSRALAPPGKKLPGSDALLQSLGDHCVWLTRLHAGGPHHRKHIVALIQVAAAHGAMHLPSGSLLGALDELLVMTWSPPLGPSVVLSALESYACLARHTIGTVGGRERPCASDATLCSLLDQLIANADAQSVFVRRPADVGSALFAVATFVRDPSALALHHRRGLQAGVETSISVESPSGQSPLPAGVLLKLGAVLVWVAQSSSPMPTMVVEACRRWAISPTKVQVTAAALRQVSSD